MNRECEEQQGALATRKNELITLEERIRYLRHPIDLESDFSTLQSRHSHLLAIHKQNEYDHMLKKKAILQKFNEALRLCAEHREFQSLKLKELNEYLSMNLNRDPDRLSVCLLSEQELLLNSSA